MYDFFKTLFNQKSNVPQCKSNENNYTFKSIEEREVVFIKAKSISKVYDIENPHFWEHHNKNHNDYIELAKKSIILFDKWKKGAKISDLMLDKETSDFAGAYLSSNQIIKVYRYPEGTYRLVDDGRHRVAAAQELDLHIPVVVIGEYITTSTQKKEW